MSPLQARVIHAASLADDALDFEAIETSQVVAGDPTIRALAIETANSYEIGVWQHDAGTTTDIEHDEVFVVLAGQATVFIEDGPTLHVAAGDVALLPAGARTTWTVQEPLRKVYVLLPP